MSSLLDPVEIIYCCYSGGIYHNLLHGVTLRIPEGAIPTGQTWEISIGVCYSGNFKFPDCLSPVSAIVWLCNSPNADFLVPIEVIIPHFLDCEATDDAQHMGIRFLKASHISTVKEIPFISVDGEVDFTLLKNKGILQTRHFCFLCISAPDVPTILERQMLCISCAVPRLIGSYSDVYFFVTYMLPTCLSVSVAHIGVTEIYTRSYYCVPLLFYFVFRTWKISFLMVTSLKRQDPSSLLAKYEEHP